MTIEFLANSPASLKTQSKIKELLINEKAARIFMLTGNISATRSLQGEFLEILNWVLEKEGRELRVLVGTFGTFVGNEFVSGNGDMEAQTIANLVVKTLSRISSPRPLDARFYCVKQWHVKAIGMTGAGTNFSQASAVIFGSTNYTASALSFNYEFDTYIDNEGCGKDRLSEVIGGLGRLIKKAIKKDSIEDFHKKVSQKIIELNKNCSIKPVGSGLEFTEEFNDVR